MADLVDVRRFVTRRLQPVLLVTALAVVLGSAGLAWRGHEADGRWHEVLADVALLEARLGASVDARPALWGETTDESAEPHYERALRLVAGWDPETVATARREETDEARAARARFLEEGGEGAEALAALHRGAHAARATRTVEWERGFELRLRKLMHARFLTQLAEMKAATLLEEGRALEAVGVLLDALQFAGDMAQGPVMIEEMIGLGLLAPNLLVDGVADGTLLALPDEARERLVDGVTALDRRLTWRVPGFEAELVLTARGLDTVLRDEGGTRRWMGEDLGLTRGQLFGAQCVETMLGLCAEFDHAYLAGPDALFEKIDGFEERFESQRNPISALVLPRFDNLYRARLGALGRFRLLAHALAPSDPPRDDWLAEYLRAEETDDGARLRLDHPIFAPVEVLVAR